MRKGRAAGARYRVARLAGLALLIGLVATTEVWRSWQQTTVAAERSVAGLVGLLAEQTERTIQAIDFTLIGMRDALQVAPSLPPDPAFGAAMEGLSIRDDDFVAFLLRDGTVIARTPNHDATIGQSYADSSLRLLAATHGGGVTWSTSPIDGVKRMVGYRVLAQGAVIVPFGLSSSTIYDTWLEHIAVVGGAAVLVWALASGLMLLRLKHRRRDRLERVRAAQAQRLEMMGRIAGGIAHDLGNTVKIARTTFSLLRPSLASRRDELQLVDEADRSLKSAFDIIDRLLAFARRQELNPRATDLAELITGFAPILRQAAGPHAELDLDIAKPLVCRVDPIHLESALLNLVLNSKDALPDGGRIVIEVREAQAPAGRRLGRTRLRARAPARPWAEIVVRDDGVGMARDVQEQVFEPFFTTRNGGSGLGLSQVLGFVQQSAGEIRIESKEGGGTAVRLLFPIASDPAEAAVSGSTARAGT